jgi:hypothetical protein
MKGNSRQIIRQMNIKVREGSAGKKWKDRLWRGRKKK